MTDKKKSKPDLSDIFAEDMDSEFPEEEEASTEKLDDDDDDFNVDEDDSSFEDDDDDDDDDSSVEVEAEEEKVESSKPKERSFSKRSSASKNKPSKKSKSKSKNKDPFHVDLGGLDTSVLRVVPSGTIDSRFPINKYIASKGRKDRIAILSSQVLIAKIHYVKGYGYFHCFGGKCCEDSFAKTRYIYLIIRYDTSSKGKVISSEYEIQYLDLPHTKYEAQIVPSVEDGEDITANDMRITCTKTDMQEFQLHALSNSYWKSSKFDSDQIIKDAEKLQKHIAMAIAKKITEAQYDEDVLGMTVNSDDDYDELDDLQ